MAAATHDPGVLRLIPAGICLLLALAGCSGRSGGGSLPIDSLATDRERLMLVNHLPPGMDEKEVRERLPALGPTDSLDGAATQPFTLLGQPVSLEVSFREGRLTGCGYRFVAADSAIGSMMYRELQRVYTEELGNYHEQFLVDDRPASSLWSSAAYRLLLTLLRKGTGFEIVWRFEQREAPPGDGEPAVRQGKVTAGRRTA